MLSMYARDFLGMTVEQIWTLPDVPLILVFDDGEIETTMRETIYSSYIWDVHRNYPKTPMKKSHHIGKMRLGTRTHLDLLGAAVWDCRDRYEQDGEIVDMEFLSKLSYEVANNLFNDMTLRLEEYVASICALDFVHVLKHPTIMKSHEALIKSKGFGGHNVVTHNEIVKKVLLDPNELAGNALAKAAKSGMVKIDQIQQCVGARGNVTDIDQTVFPRPVLLGFGHGFKTLEDVMKESRSASKSLLYTKDPMKKSEYFNRNIQLSSATLINLHHVDCGSRDYLPITIKNTRLLKDMTGFAYLDETDGVEKVIKKGQFHLVGKTIQARTVFTCKHPDRYGVCVRCFGEVGQSVPAGTNVGHISASEMQSKLTQLLMSNKHLDGNATVEELFLDDYDAGYLCFGKLENHMYLQPGLAKRKFTITIAEQEAPNLSDIHTVKNVSQLIPSRLSEMTELKFTFLDAPEDRDDLRNPPIVHITSGTRSGSLTNEMLEFLRKRKWTIDENGNYIFDMEGWDFSKPFVILPLKNFSTVDYMLTIESFIKGGLAKGVQSIMSYDTPSAALMAFHDLVSQKLEVSLSYLQTIVMSTMVQSRHNRDYNLPMPREIGHPAHYRQQMALRSLAAAMAFQSQADIIYSPVSFLVKDRPAHPLDDALMG